MPPKTRKPKPEPPQSERPTTWPTPALDNKELQMSYRIARGEQGVLTFEPYKSILLPHWRFKTIPIATHSSTVLKSAFDFYVKAGDFVGADMARKFIQMGMTRAKRYANHKGGKKYDRSAREVERKGGARVELAKSEGHEGREEKLAVSELFKEVWRRCVEDEGYAGLKGEFLKEQRDWDHGQVKVLKKDEGSGVKTEVKQEDNGSV